MEARAATGRRVGAFYNQEGGALRELGAETSQTGAYKADILAGIGRKAGQDIAAAGDVYVKYLDHKEISQGAVAFANYTDVKTREWNDTVKTADPNDPTVAAKFREGIEPDLDKLKESFTTENGQRWAESHVDRLRNHFFEKTAADMSTLAGHAVAVNHKQTVNSLSSAVHGDPTPSSLDFSLETLRSSTEATIGSSPNLTGTAAAKVRSELLQSGQEAIVKSAVLGAIEANGKVPDWASDPKYSPYINGAELKQFEKAAEAQRRSNLYYDRAASAYQKQQDEARVHAAINKAWADNVTIDEATNRPQIKPQFFKDVLAIARNNPDAPNAATVAKTYMDWGERMLRQDAKNVVSDPAVKQDLTDRMFDENNPTTVVDVMKAQMVDKLSPADFKKLKATVEFLEKEPLRDPVFKATKEGVKGLLGTDPIGKGKFADFMQDFIPQYQAAKRAGKATSADLDLKNPDSMIRQAMKPYERSATQILQDRIMRGENVITPPPASSTFTPPTTWQFSPSLKQYRDPASGKRFDLNGKEIK